jgi:hypothetical protein
VGLLLEREGADAEPLPLGAEIPPLSCGQLAPFGNPEA